LSILDQIIYKPRSPMIAITPLDEYTFFFMKRNRSHSKCYLFLFIVHFYTRYKKVKCIPPLFQIRKWKKKNNIIHMQNYDKNMTDLCMCPWKRETENVLIHGDNVPPYTGALFVLQGEKKTAYMSCTWYKKKKQPIKR
jgi:hypothetical protein